MLVLVPRSNVNTLSKDLLHWEVPRILAAMKLAEVTIQLPRFTAEFEEDLVPALQRLDVSWSRYGVYLRKIKEL